MKHDRTQRRERRKFGRSDVHAAAAAKVHQSCIVAKVTLAGAGKRDLLISCTDEV